MPCGPGCSTPMTKQMPDSCDGCKHKPGRYFGKCCHCSRNPKATDDYYELEAKYETCAHGFVMQINDDDGYPLSKDRGCDVGKIPIPVDECDCPVDCPDYELRKGSVAYLGEAKEIEKMLDEEIEKHDPLSYPRAGYDPNQQTDPPEEVEKP